MVWRPVVFLLEPMEGVAALLKGMHITMARYEVHLLLESLPRSELHWTRNSELFLPLPPCLVEALI